MPVVRGSRLNNRTRPAVGAPAAPLTTEAHPSERPTDRVSQESRRERHQREIFERLVEAARQLMFDRSFAGARVQDITDLADVGKGTFFNFFSTKELVIPEITRERVRRHRQSVDQMKAGQVSSREALNQIIGKSLERKVTPADWHNYFGTFVTSMAHDERVRSSISDLIREGEQLVCEVVAFGQKSGEFRNDRDTSDLANYLVRAFLGLQLMAWVHGVGLNADELEANARLTFHLLLCPPSSTRQARKVARSPMRSSQRPKSAHTKRKRRSSGGSH